MLNPKLTCNIVKGVNNYRKYVIMIKITIINLKYDLYDNNIYL